jgi:hypothetical protein
VKFNADLRNQDALLKASPRFSLGQRGYALAEVLVAAAILGFLVTSLYGAFSFGFGVIKLSKEDVRADQIMVERLEALRIYNWTNVTTAYFPTNFTEYLEASDTNGIGTLFNGTFTISPAPITESYSNTLRQATVKVSWTSGTVPRQRTMTTLVSKNGIQTYKP